MARCRLGKEMREGKYWKEKENNVCILCGIEETWEHAWEGCKEWSKTEGSWQEVIGKILGEEEEGE